MTETGKRIVFVDEDERVLQGLRRLLHGFREEWTMRFVSRAEEALALLAEAPVDALITDLRLADMSGVDLLKIAREKSPDTVRIIFAGSGDRDSILKSADHIHQFLTKPLDALQVKSAVDRSLAVRDSLSAGPVRDFVASVDSMPSVPAVYNELMQELRATNASMKRVGAILARDIGLTARLLRLVNSVAFGLPRHVVNVEQAANLLGLEMIKSLVLPVQLFSMADFCRMPYLSIERLWDHSLSVGALAKRLMEDLGASRLLQDYAFTAGLLSDAGILLIASKRPKPYEKVIAHMQAEAIALPAAERATLGTTHAEVGAYLMALWSLPTTVVEALAYHHTPSASGSRELTPLTALHVATSTFQAHLPSETAEPSFDENYLNELGLLSRLPHFAEIAAALGVD